MQTGLERIRQLVTEHPDRKLQTLMHMVNYTSLTMMHYKQKTGKAAGVDRETKESYEAKLDENIADLLVRMKSFSYVPQPVRRAYISKGEGKMRPLGIPAYEDRLVQGVMAEILSAIYEPKFQYFSYGYRPQRGCHSAVKSLVNRLQTKIDWVVDVDIKGFFDNVDHEWLMKFLEHDIEDKNFLRYVKRFLRAGVMEEGQYQETDRGTPQGGLISPVLANIYLHYVVDIWFNQRIKKNCRGTTDMIRYADDMVMLFEREEDAKEVYELLKERLGKFGLELSEEKSKIVRFGKDGVEDNGTFDFLGFTLYWGTSRKGKPLVKLQTSKKKLKAKRLAVKQWFKVNMHLRADELIAKLNLKMRGHYQYYGITHNYDKLCSFYWYVTEQLRKVWRRRSQRDRTSWDDFKRVTRFNPILQPAIHVNLYS